MWKDLSMQQRADLMDIYLSHGVTSLDEMRNHYDSRNQYSEGGSIHIKPENRGKFTALKKRTGHSASWFKVHGTPAQKKMATFELNARKWKHGYGGNLYDGITESTQQMNNGKVLVTNSYGDNYYIDPRQVNSTEWNLTTPEVSVTANPDDVARGRAERWFRDFGTESNDATSVAGGRKQNSHLDEWGIEGAAKAAAWAKDHPVLNNVGLGLSTIPLAVAATPAVVGGGELAATALANPYVDAALISMGGAHAAQSLANGEANWMTALELAPLGRLAKPVWNVAKPTRNFIPTLESNMSGVKYAYNRNPELANIGTLEDYNNYLKTIFPESKVRDINYHMGPKGLQELKPSTGKVYNTNPDARGIYVTPDKSYAQKLRKYTTSRLENPSFFTYIKRNLIPGGWDKANDVFTDIYPVMIDTKNPLLTKGNWTWGIKDKKYKSLMNDYDAIVNSGPKWYQNFNSMPETIVPKTEQSLILGSDADVAGFRRFMSNPQITAENAASITPEQWTAAQDAAIARGDMVEAQRLRDLHFKVNTPQNRLVAYTEKYINGNRVLEQEPVIDFYHNSDESGIVGFDPTKTGKNYKGSTRFRDTDIYVNAFNPASYYGKNKYKLRVYAEKPLIVENVPDFYEGMSENEIKYLNNIKQKYINGNYDAIYGDYGWGEGLQPGEVVVRNPNQIKLADAVTYDDNGIRIPLGERDNFNINDIRYGLIPFGIGLTGYGLWNNKKQE